MKARARNRNTMQLEKCYSKEELYRLDDLFTHLINKGLHWPWNKNRGVEFNRYGHVRRLPLYRVLADDFPKDLRRHDEIGRQVCGAIDKMDSAFFERIAIVLDAKKEGRDLASLTKKELKLPSTRGRKPGPRDLKFIFPIVLFEIVTERRLRGMPFADSAEQVLKISRKDFMKALGGRVSESELSRQIAKYPGLAELMAEQPIAKKLRKRS